MTIDLKAIRARADAATAGPWDIAYVDTGHPYIMVDGRDLLDEDEIADPMRNATLIAAARTDIPALLDWVEAAVPLLATLKLDIEQRLAADPEDPAMVMSLRIVTDHLGRLKKGTQ